MPWANLPDFQNRDDEPLHWSNTALVAQSLAKVLFFLMSLLVLAHLHSAQRPGYTLTQRQATPSPHPFSTINTTTRDNCFVRYADSVWVQRLAGFSSFQWNVLARRLAFWDSLAVAEVCGTWSIQAIQCSLIVRACSYYHQVHRRQATRVATPK